MKRTLNDRLLSRLNILGPTDCWTWKGSLTKKTKGYGSLLDDNGKPICAHRAAWQIANKQKVPNGQKVLHSCDNSLCCNPDHLFLGTQADNMRDMFSKGRQSIPSGDSCAHAKITSQQALNIKTLSDHGVSQKTIARQMGIAQTSVSAIMTGKTWNAVTGIPRARALAYPPSKYSSTESADIKS